jgi:hypothetical protein
MPRLSQFSRMAMANLCGAEKELAQRRREKEINALFSLCVSASPRAL